MVGVNGDKFPAIRQHLQENIGNVYKDMDTSCVTTFTLLVQFAERRSALMSSRL